MSVRERLGRAIDRGSWLAAALAERATETGRALRHGRQRRPLTLTGSAEPLPLPRSGRASVQRDVLRLADVEADCLLVQSGRLRLLRGVLECSGLDLRRLEPAGQEKAMTALSAFLNGLAFPVQLVARSERADLAVAVAAKRARLASGRFPDALVRLGEAQIAHLQTLAAGQTLMRHRFCVVVPGDHERQVGERCEEVAYGLARAGVVARRLTGPELVSLLAARWGVTDAEVDDAHRQRSGGARPPATRPEPVVPAESMEAVLTGAPVPAGPTGRRGRHRRAHTGHDTPAPRPAQAWPTQTRPERSDG